MKILWLSHFIPYPPKGGSLLRSYNLFKELARDHEIYLVSLIQEDILKTMYPTVNEGLREAETHLSELCESIKFFPMPADKFKFGKYWMALRSLFSRKPYSINWLLSNPMYSELVALNERIEFDAIHFDTVGLAEYSPIFPTTPKTLTHHNIESHMMLRRASKETNVLKKLYYYIEGKKIEHYELDKCLHFDVNITCSELDLARLSELIPGVDSAVIPNGVDVDYFNPVNVSSKENSLIFVGGLNWYPNKEAMNFFVDLVWPLIKKINQNITFDLVGQSPPKKFLDLSSEDESFRVHGFVNDVRDYINDAQIYICPIMDGGGTKLKILDALSMGKVIVANPVACEGINVEENVNVIYAVTPDEYVDKIIMLLNDEALCKTIGSNARKLAKEQYSYTAIGKSLSDLYTGLLPEG